MQQVEFCENESENMLVTEYASVRYIEDDKVVLLTWKKPAYLENYRKPTTFALELLRKYDGSNFIIDARHGFEDDKRDVEWGFSWLLPEMSKTSCRFVSFIMNSKNDIEDEMDMWTVKFGKYFAVTRAQDYEAAKATIHNYIMVKIRYGIKVGKRAEFVDKLTEAGIAEASRQEPGNITYELYYPLDSEDDVCLLEMWTNQTEQKRHGTTAHYGILSELKTAYVEKFDISCYTLGKQESRYVFRA